MTLSSRKVASCEVWRSSPKQVRTTQTIKILINRYIEKNQTIITRDVSWLSKYFGYLPLNLLL